MNYFIPSMFDPRHGIPQDIASSKVFGAPSKREQIKYRIKQ